MFCYAKDLVCQRMIICQNEKKKDLLILYWEFVPQNYCTIVIIQTSPKYPHFLIYLYWISLTCSLKKRNALWSLHLMSPTRGFRFHFCSGSSCNFLLSCVLSVRVCHFCLWKATTICGIAATHQWSSPIIWLQVSRHAFFTSDLETGGNSQGTKTDRFSFFCFCCFCILF